VAVRDFEKANELVAKIIGAMSEEGEGWTKTEKDGVQFFSQPMENPWLSFSPTLALSKDRLVLGHDAAGVEAVMKRGAPDSSQLTAADGFKAAERLLPAGKDLFVYFDTALIYSRLDAALRPMLIMAAAFMPSIGNTVDLGKLPEAEIVTRHLSPIVMTQRYENDGYVTESIGPVSMFQAVIAAAAGMGFGGPMLKDKLPPFGTATGATPPAVLIPAPSPTPSPDE
jgi:hypothetical protein